jgi:Zn-dependent M16 (insulinase) family peptidase
MLLGRALDRNVKPFVELLTDLVARLEIDPRRLKEVIAESATRLESSIANLGFQFAILRAHSKLSSEGAINDRLQGIGMLHVMRDLARLGDAEVGDLIDKLNAMRTRLFTRDSIQVVVSCEQSIIETIRDLLHRHLPGGGADGGRAEKPEPL